MIWKIHTSDDNPRVFVFIPNFETLKYFCQTKDKCSIGYKNAFFVQSLLGKILDLIMSIIHCVFCYSADFQHYQRIWVQAPLCQSDWKWTLNGRHSAWIGHQLRLRKPEDYPWGFPIELISPSCYHGLHIVPMYQSSLIVASLSLLWHVCSHIHIDGLVQERHNSIALAMEFRLSCSDPLIWEGEHAQDVTPL